MTAKQGWKTIGKILLWLDAIGVVVLTAVYMLFGEALISSFLDEGKSQTMGSIAWFFASFFGSICTMISVDAFLVAVILIGGALWGIFGSMRKSSVSKNPANPPSPVEPTDS